MEWTFLNVCYLFKTFKIVYKLCQVKKWAGFCNPLKGLGPHKTKTITAWGKKWLNNTSSLNLHARWKYNIWLVFSHTQHIHCPVNFISHRKCIYSVTTVYIQFHLLKSGYYDSNLWIKCKNTIYNITKLLQKGLIINICRHKLYIYAQH